MQWEKLCRDAVTGNLVNRVVYGKAKRWWGSVLNEDKKPEQVEFDVMVESLEKKYLLFLRTLRKMMLGNETKNILHIK